jgi:hypothetical protein
MKLAFSQLQSVQINSGAYPDAYRMCTGGSVSRSKDKWDVKLTLTSSAKYIRNYTFTPPYISWHNI